MNDLPLYFLDILLLIDQLQLLLHLAELVVPLQHLLRPPRKDIGSFTELLRLKFAVLVLIVISPVERDIGHFPILVPISPELLGLARDLPQQLDVQFNLVIDPIQLAFEVRHRLLGLRLLRLQRGITSKIGLKLVLESQEILKIGGLL